MTKSDYADCSKTFECKEHKKFKIDVYIEIHESLNFLQRRRNRGFFNNLGPPSGGPSRCRQNIALPFLRLQQLLGIAPLPCRSLHHELIPTFFPLFSTPKPPPLKQAIIVYNQ